MFEELLGDVAAYVVLMALLVPFIYFDTKWFEPDEPRSKAWTIVLTFFWIGDIVVIGYLATMVGNDVATG